MREIQTYSSQNFTSDTQLKQDISYTPHTDFNPFKPDSLNGGFT